MKDITELIALDWRNGALFVAGIIIIFVFMIQKWDWIIQRFGIISKKALAEEKRDSEILELKTHADKTDENFDKISNSIKVLQESVNELSNKVVEMQKRNDENEAARIKDRVAQAYRYYHQAGKLTKMEKEALEENIKAYSQYSSNSFIHSVVEKELPTWEVIDE